MAHPETDQSRKHERAIIKGLLGELSKFRRQDVQVLARAMNSERTKR